MYAVLCDDTTQQPTALLLSSSHAVIASQAQTHVVISLVFYRVSFSAVASGLHPARNSCHNRVKPTNGAVVNSRLRAAGPVLSPRGPV